MLDKGSDEELSVGARGMLAQFEPSRKASAKRMNYGTGSDARETRKHGRDDTCKSGGDADVEQMLADITKRGNQDESSEA